MNLEAYDNDDGFRVWLGRTEYNTLLGQVDDSTKEIAFRLAGECGLRSKEVTNVTPEHVTDTDAGWMLQVWDSKGSRYRETAIPPELATRINTIDDVRTETADTPIVDVSTRTLRRWMQTATGQLQERDDRWQYVGFHDLRRTWAGQLRQADVEAMLVCEWGGWNDLETFLEHYKGVMTPEGQREQREKVDWL